MRNLTQVGERWAICLLLLLAFGLRIGGLADHNIWWDEGIGVWLARMSVAESVQWTAGDVHPPLYYILLRGWYVLAGEGEFVLRFPSVLFSFLTVPLIYRLGKVLGDESQSRMLIGVLAALFLTLSRFAIIWAQEIRMYALASMWATAALWAAVWLWKQGGRRAWLAYVLSTLGALYSLYLTVTVPLVANLGFVVAWWHAQRPHRMLKTWLLAQITVMALYLPWLAYALPRMHSWSSESAFSPGFFVQLYATMLTVGSPLNLETYLPWTVSIFVVLGGALFYLIRTRQSPAQSGALAMLLGGLVLPAAVVLVISLPILRFYYSRPLVPRYLLPLSACFYALLAWGITAIASPSIRTGGVGRRGAAWMVTLLVVGVLGIGVRAFYPGRARRDDYAAIAHILEAHRQPNDAVLLYVDRDWPIFVAHYAGDYQTVSYGAALMPATVEALLSPIWDAAEGLWLVTTPQALQTDPQQTVPAWLESHAKVGHTWVSGENSLSFYARTIQRQHTLYELTSDFVPPAELEVPAGADGVLLGAHFPLPRYRTGDTLRLSLYWLPPPVSAVTVTLLGPETRDVAVPAPSAALQGATHQQVDIPLAPDLPGGRYHVWVSAGEEAGVSVGRFTLVRSAAGVQISPSDISHRVAYQLGEDIHLIGYDLPQRALAPGDFVELTLYWQTERAIDKRYKVFTHLLGEVYNAEAGNFLWGQQDNEPGHGQALTTLWTPGTVIVDTYRIPVHPAAPPGMYTLEIGMYGLVDGVRLPVLDAEVDSQGNAIFLTDIVVQE